MTEGARYSPQAVKNRFDSRTARLSPLQRSLILVFFGIMVALSPTFACKTIDQWGENARGRLFGPPTPPPPGYVQPTPPHGLSMHPAPTPRANEGMPLLQNTDGADGGNAFREGDK